ncbi:hypothetical protein IQ07DRAFT_658331 [Pyrenochaeta sp. DS3sAY3a]|nr:hypothetical protein IQ07DRAFT_658331 [Pyrenochaeta sp. DS3sAY3a]
MATESKFETKDGLQPGHDIFYTPDNASFYATKPYSQLNPAQQEVRLLRLLPYSGQGLIECELLEATPLLNVKGRYTALSYCAGSPRETDVILLNGTQFNVFASLGHALKQIRNFWDQTFPDRECIVWIDQICINQNDIGERSHQVRFMREIYEYSEQVLACLSTEDTDPKGMDWFLEVVKCEGRTAFGRNRSYFWGDLQDTKYVEGWVAFYDIVEAAWWKRAWVFQEFIVAPTLYFIYGGRSVSWENFRRAFTAVFSAHSQVLDAGRKLPKKKHWELQDCNLDLLVQRTMGGGSDAIEKGEFMLRNKVDWSGSMDLKELLNHSRYCDCSDPRDRVFAFLGLANLHYGILPDYSQTLV